MRKTSSEISKGVFHERFGFAAFYADCVHEVRPITAGCRLALVYSLRFLGKKRPPQPPDYRTERRRIEELLRLWTEATDEADKLILPLEHAYTPAIVGSDGKVGP
jgi:hypothetical protein